MRDPLALLFLSVAALLALAPPALEVASIRVHSFKALDRAGPQSPATVSRSEAICISSSCTLTT